MSSSNETFIGKTIETIQKDYFKDYLINVSKGWYYYGKKGLEGSAGDLLLFQIDSQVIASAKLEDIIHFSKPTIDGCTGALIIDRKTIKIFNTISKNELSKYISGFKDFNQSKQKFEISDVNMNELMKRMDCNE